jgi:hypothetical protein
MRTLVFGAFAASLLLQGTLGNAPARAEDDVAKTVHDKLIAKVQSLQDSCAGDIRKYCKAVTPGEGRVIYCLQAFEDKISAKCQFELEETVSTLNLSADGLKDIVTACRAEITGPCGKVQPGQGRVAACLLQNKASASKECSDAIQKVESALQK